MRKSDEAAGKERVFFRAGDRIYRDDEAWYYSTREGEHGPFKSKEDAAADMKQYVSMQGHLDKLVDKGKPELNTANSADELRILDYGEENGTNG